MMELDGLMQPMEGLEDFHEATWVHKYNGKYYLSYSDNHDENWNDGVKGDNRMRYAVSDSPLGPWESKGIYMEPTDSYTNHGSIVEFKGQWYSFYHNSALSGHDWDVAFSGFEVRAVVDVYYPAAWRRLRTGASDAGN